jgi:hypothetical protein
MNIATAAMPASGNTPLLENHEKWGTLFVCGYGWDPAAGGGGPSNCESSTATFWLT